MPRKKWGLELLPPPKLTADKRFTLALEYLEAENLIADIVAGWSPPRGEFVRFADRAFKLTGADGELERLTFRCTKSSPGWPAPLKFKASSPNIRALMLESIVSRTIGVPAADQGSWLPLLRPSAVNRSFGARPAAHTPS
jgi:hypothetical protein